MAVAMDLGNPNSTYGSIHPTDKTDVGNRLALAGLAVGYGKDKYYTGPLVANVKRQTKPPSTALEVTFKSLGEEIEVRNTAGFEVFYASFIPQNMQKSHLSLSCDPTFGLRVLLYASDLFARKFAAEIVTCFWQPEPYAVNKNVEWLEDLWAIIAVWWMEISEPAQGYLLGRWRLWGQTEVRLLL